MVWTSRAEAELRRGVDVLGMTGRGWDRVRRVARTIADLDGRTPIEVGDVTEALDLRGAM
jgi:predicted ATPase with chaperone activity